MKKILLALFFAPSFSLACVVEKDGSYDCSGSESPLIEVKTEEDKALFKKSRLALNSNVSKIEETCIRSNESIMECLCNNPILKNRLENNYDLIVAKKPEWDDKLVKSGDKNIKMDNIKTLVKYNKCKI